MDILEHYTRLSYEFMYSVITNIKKFENIILFFLNL